MEYAQSTYASYTSALTGLGVFILMLVALHATGSTVAHIRMNARTALEGAITAPVALQWLTFFISDFAVACYWLMLVFSFYWLVFFKLQVRRESRHEGGGPSFFSLSLSPPSPLSLSPSTRCNPTSTHPCTPPPPPPLLTL